MHCERHKHGLLLTFADTVDENCGSMEIQYLVAKEAQCSKAFPDRMDEGNLVDLFEHLHCCHRIHYDNITNDFDSWVRGRQVS